MGKLFLPPTFKETMKFKTVRFLIFSFLFSLTGAIPLSASQLQVSVTLVPQKYFVKKIGGDRVKVNVLVKPGANPHTYEPKPRQMARLKKSKLYFSIGSEFETIWLPRFQSSNRKLKIIKTTAGIPRLEMDGHVHGEDEHDDEHGHDEHNDEHGHDEDDEKEDHSESGTDPHLWLSPLLVKIQATHIYHALVEASPKDAALFQKNYLLFQQELDQLYFEISKIIQKGKHREFVVFHPSWGYFAHTFELTQVSIEVEGKKPKPAQLKKVIQKIKKSGITTVFVQPQFSKRSAEVVARAIGGSVLIANPLAEDWAENLRNLAKQISAQ